MVHVHQQRIEEKDREFIKRCWESTRQKEKNKEENEWRVAIALTLKKIRDTIWLALNNFCL